MPTGVAGPQARNLVTQQVHYLRLKMVPTPGVFQPFNADLPSGANILRVSTAIRTTFNGTTPTISVGTSGTPALVVNAAAAAGITQGRNALAQVAATGVSMTGTTRLGVTLAGAGMNAGDGDAEVEFTINNDA